MLSPNYRPLTRNSLDPDQATAARHGPHLTTRSLPMILFADPCGPTAEALDCAGRELLSDGCQIEIRALRREDEADMLAAVGKTSAQSLQRRFFVMKRHFSDKERPFFLDVDFKNHVAIVALTDEAGRKVIVGGGRYIVFEPGRV